MFDWIVGVVTAAGLVGVALLMFGENIFPPLPSEVIMPLAGYAAARGDLSFAGVVAAGSLGALAGAWVWFYAGRRLGEARVRRLAERHGRWLTLHPRELDTSKRFFREHGGWAVFLGRLIPAVRTFISVPAGVLGMAQARFLFWTTLGTTLWTLLLAGAGYVLASQHDRVAQWLDPITTAVLAGIAAAYVWRVVRYDPNAETD